MYISQLPHLPSCSLESAEGFFKNLCFRNDIIIMMVTFLRLLAEYPCDGGVQSDGVRV